MPLTTIAAAMPQCTAGVKRARPDLRKYERLIATMRKASKPSRSVMTRAWKNAWSMKRVQNEIEILSQDRRFSLPSSYPTGQGGFERSQNSNHLHSAPFFV